MARCNDCAQIGTGIPGLDPTRRAASCCALPDFDTNHWTGGGAHAQHMGQAPLYHLIGLRKDAHRPLEDPRDLGCFASWWRSGFVTSLDRYRRDRDDSGNRVANPFLDRCTDRFVLECIAALESFEDAAHSDYMEAVHTARMRAADNQRKAR